MKCASLVVVSRGTGWSVRWTFLFRSRTTCAFLLVARWLYPRPEDLEGQTPPESSSAHLPGVFWLYLIRASLVAVGFADFQLIAYHFEKADAVGPVWVPVTYSIAMGISGLGSLVFGRMFDRSGIRILVRLTIISAVFAPSVLLGGFWPVILGSAVWGPGMGVHESIVPAAAAAMVPARRRASAYGLFTGGCGETWFMGSAIIGALYDVSIGAVVVFCLALQLAAIPIFVRVARLAASPLDR